VRGATFTSDGKVAPLIRPSGTFSLYVPETSRTETGDIENGFLRIDPNRRWIFLRSLTGAVGGVGNASFIGVFQELWEDAASSRLSIARHLP